MRNLNDITFLEAVHKGVDLGLHTNVLFRGMKVAGLDFYQLYADCATRTQTSTGAWKLMRRIQRAYYLAKYVEYADALQAPKAECGVFRGLSGLITCHVQKSLRPEFAGEDYYLIDSYQGLSESKESDLAARQLSNGQIEWVHTHRAGHFAVPMDVVAANFDEFPRLNFVAGWIPKALTHLPETKWSFVHIDVDLFEPTLGCLEYFMPRMVPGGVILNDDFSSPLFPGGGKAWAQYFGERSLPYLVLDTGQSVYVKPL